MNLKGTYRKVTVNKDMLKDKKRRNMSKTLYLVRHGQTLFNLKNYVQGWCDSKLTDFGHLQAQKAGEYLKNRGVVFDKAYCSDLSRTEETLKEITNLPYERKFGLRERHYGILEGDSCILGFLGHDSEDYYTQFGGETTTQLQKRLYETLKEIMEDPEVENVLAISHGDAMLNFAFYVDKENADRLFKFANCVIYIFEYEDGQFTLKEMIDEHVKDLKDPNKKD